MKLKIRVLSIVLFFIWGTTVINAQEKPKIEQYDHEFSIWGGGGISTLNYEVSIGDRSLKNIFGGHFGLGYHYFFSPNWGVGTGFELAFYNNMYNLKNLQFSYPTTDIDGNNFEYRSNINKLKEKQNAMFLQIPLMMQYESRVKGDKFFVAFGGKFDIPLSGKYKNSASLSNSGWYEYEQSLYNTQEFMGFGNYKGKKSSGDLDLKIAFTLSVDLGLKWRLKEHWALYTGIYADYGFINTLNSKKVADLPSIVEYNVNNPKNFEINSILNSQYTQSPAKKFTEKAYPWAGGLKLRLAYGKNCKKEQPPVLPPIIPAPEEPKKQQPEPEPAAVEETPETVESVPEVVEDEAPAVVEETPPVKETPVVEEKKPEIPEKETSKDTDALNKAKKQIEEPIDNYALNQSDVAAYQQKRLEEKIAQLQKYPDLRFYIQGHTCDLGTAEVNEKVGLARAAKVKAYLISKGIKENRILGISSKRDTQPVAPNTNEDNRRKNRRVEILIE